MLRRFTRQFAGWRRWLVQDVTRGKGRRRHFLETVLLVVLVLSFVGVLTFFWSGGTSRQTRTAGPPATAQKTAPKLRYSEVEIGKTQDFVAMSSATVDGETQSGDGRVVQMTLSAEIDTKQVDERKADKWLKHYQQRVREVIGIAARAATDEELAEPDLQTLRSRIRQRLNRLFGEELIHDVAVSQFLAFEVANGTVKHATR